MFLFICTQMFKSLAAAALITLSSLSAAPANARPSTCWMSNPDSYSRRMPATYCDVHRRINANGHTVFDIRWRDGSDVTVVLWNNNTAEVIFDDTIKVFETYIDSRGDVRLVGRNGFEFSFRM